MTGPADHSNVVQLKQWPRELARSPGSDPGHAGLRSRPREQVLVNEMYRQAQYLQRLLNRCPEARGHDEPGAGRPAQRPDPDQTIVQMYGAMPAATPVEVAQNLSMNVAELKGALEARLTRAPPGASSLPRAGAGRLDQEQDELLARLGDTPPVGRLRFFSAYVAAQVLTLCGLLVAFLVVQFGPLPPIGLADFGFIGTAHAQLLHGGDPLRSVMTLTAFGLVLICLGAYALSIYVMFLSPRPTRAQVDLAKFYSGFCTGLLTHLFSMTTT